jgi:hypothetical protein
MIGDDRVRHCGGCARSVYNVSAMTRNEAEDFLKEHGLDECVRMHRRVDGTLITDNCPVGLRKIRHGIYRLTAYVASIIASIIVLQPARVEAGGDSQGTHDRPNASGNRSQAPDHVYPRSGLLIGKLYRREEIFTRPGSSPGVERANKGVITITPQVYKAADGDALHLYLQAKQSEAQGKFLLAKTQYEQALQAATGNPGHDPLFKETIRSCLEKVQLHIVGK